MFCHRYDAYEDWQQRNLYHRTVKYAWNNTDVTGADEADSVNSNDACFSGVFSYVCVAVLVTVLCNVVLPSSAVTRQLTAATASQFRVHIRHSVTTSLGDWRTPSSRRLPPCPRSRNWVTGSPNCYQLLCRNKSRLEFLSIL